MGLVFRSVAFTHWTRNVKNTVRTCKSYALFVICCHSFIFENKHICTDECVSSIPPRRKSSEFDRGRAIAWLQDGVSKREATRRLQVSYSVIVRLNERLRATGRVQERPRSGRPKKTTNREYRFLERQALQTRTACSSIIQRQLRVATHTNISRTTVRKRLHCFGIRPRRPAKRSRLTPADRAARGAFCRRQARWTRPQRAQVRSNRVEIHPEPQ